MLKKLSSLLLLALLLVPGMVSAETVNPVNGNAWTLYVFGNGDAISNILEAIKLLMMPDSGTTGFNNLLMFLATAGFLVLAVQAGFNPGQNLFKMFGYILVVSGVHITTMQTRANIIVQDKVTNIPYVVQGVPALVGVPAALVSEVGNWFTHTIENYYTLPSELTTTGGTFNLFGRLMTESNEYVISNPELKRSLSAYIGDCTVPAMAQGRITASDLITSPNMMATLGQATHKAILTKYFPVGAPSTSGNGLTFPESKTVGGETYNVEGGLGAVMPCEAAYTLLSEDLENHGQELLNASAKAWSKTGTLVPFEVGMSKALEYASTGGGNGFAGYSKPQGFILQQAMLSSMSGSFRTAAASIGNNDLMMAASIAQAEQNQKSSWFTAARVFSNMMGYVYTTLQAFIFAIVPIVIVALMVPGLGKSIFTNYAQILVWLTLWQPMLSIVNYLVTLFGKAQIASTLQLANGVTMQNKYVLTENTNDLMLAAQFLGTMVPLLTWGLVKGSLAFTEFISHGIGSSMAQQAGATAASGNMSMGNLSMDNTSMNKFNTAMSSAVGAQSTMGYTGAAQTATDFGGDTKAMFGSQVTKQAQVQWSRAEQAAVQNGINASESASQTLGALHNESLENRHSLSNSKSMQAMASTIDNFTTQYQAAMSAGNTTAAKEAQTAGKEVALAMVKQAQASLRAGVSGDAQVGGIIGSAVKKLTGLGVKVGVGADFSTSAQSNKQNVLKTAEQLSNELSTSLGSSNSQSSGGGRAQQAGTSETNSTNEDVARSQSVGDSRSVQDLLSSAKGRSESIGATLTYAQSQAASLSGAGHVSDAEVTRLAGMTHSIPARVEQGMTSVQGSLGQTGSSLTDAEVTSAVGQAGSKFESSPASSAAAAVGTGPTNGRPQSPANSVAALNSTGQSATNAAFDSAKQRAAGTRAENNRQADHVKTTGIAESTLSNVVGGPKSIQSLTQGLK